MRGKTRVPATARDRTRQNEWAYRDAYGRLVRKRVFLGTPNKFDPQAVFFAEQSQNSRSSYKFQQWFTHHRIAALFFSVP